MGEARIGRPSKLTPQVAAAYCALVRVGTGRSAAAREVGVNPRTVKAWAASDPDFASAVEEAEREASEPVEVQLYEAAKRGEPWAVKMWLSARESARWGEARQIVQVEHTGQLGVAVGVEVGPRLAAVEQLRIQLEDRRRALEAGPEVLDADSAEVD